MKGYEVGESVMCIANGKSSWHKNLTIGRIYKVIDKKNEVPGFSITDDIGKDWWYDYDAYFISMKKHRILVINEILLNK